MFPEPHSVLYNADILLRIFESLKDGLMAEGPKRQRAELARCIGVCKAFEDPAARVLWAELPDICPLLDLFENSIRLLFGDDLENSVREFPIYTMFREIRAGEWERFRRYAPLVRVIALDPDPEKADDEFRDGFDPDDYATICPSALQRTYPSRPQEMVGKRCRLSSAVWTYLAQQNAYQPLLPGIRYLEWDIDTPTEIGLLHLVAPTLRRLHLRFRAWETYPEEEWFGCTPMLFRSVVKLTPLLTHLKISSKNVPVQELIWDMGSCKGHVALCILELECDNREYAVDHDIVWEQGFSELEELQDLKLGVVYSPWPEHRSEPEVMVHPNLKSLTIADHSGREEVYRVFRIPSLRSLTVVHKTNVKIPASQSICRTIVSQFPSITAIRIDFRPPSYVLSHRTKQMVLAIQPLFELRNIQEASFDLRGMHVIVNDADVAAIVEAWPHLTSLSLKHPYLEGPKAPGIPALLSIARTGAKLKTLYLSHLYLAPADLSTARAEGSTPCNRSLESVRVGSVLNKLGESEAEGLPAFCTLMDALFPSLDVDKYRVHEPAGTEGREEWTKILRRIQESRSS
ncbi:hypothetical protein C8T65DRAFT_698779 [Cerioporus squamosus]|nr:hypothetical protein C8T65DRAFT_698779 [Cerioporus squamosus]